MFFWKDLNLSTTRSDKDKIAVIHFKHKIAQRKFNDRVVWERLSQNSPLYNEDTIRTADFAQAVIRFMDGTQLDVYENTMLQIYYSEDGVKISVGGGDIQVDSSNGTHQVAVAMDNGAVVKMDAGSRMAASSSSASHNIEIQSGSAAVVSDAGESHVISSGESVNIEDNGEISKNPVNVISVPKDLRVLNVDEKPVPVKLEWKSAEDNKQVIVQVSRTKDFSEIESTYKPERDSIDLPAKEGIMYWRVFPEGQTEKSVNGKVTVMPVDGVKISSPASGSEFRYRNQKPDVVFSWKGNDFASKYKLEVSRTPDMKSVIYDDEVSSSPVSLPSLAEGQYYWWVTPYYPLNDMGWSNPAKVTSFSVVKNEVLPPPVLSLPADNSKIYYKDKIPFNFAWKKDAEAYAYDLIVAKDPDFMSVIYSKTLKDSRLNEDLESSRWADGTYYWKVVRFCSDYEDENPESPVRSFTLAKYIPGVNRLIFPPDGYSVEESKASSTRFIWKLADEFSSDGSESVIQFASERDFKNISKEVPLSASVYENPDFKSGLYYWRIGVKTSEEEEASSFTEARRIVVLKELKMPEVVFPRENSVLVTYDERPLKLKWNEVDGADYYKVTVYDSEGNIAAEKAPLTEKTINFKLPPKEYKAVVQAYAEETPVSPLRYSEKKEVSFRLRYPSPVTLEMPSNHARIEGLRALREPIVFAWKNGIDKAAYSKFVLYKQLSNGTLKEVYTSENPSGSVSMNRLTEGSYRWTVRASSSDGIPLDSTIHSFEVLPVPVLLSPELVSPAEAFVMGPDYLRKNRNIVFNWNAVSGATDYIFTLYKKNPDGSLSRIHTEKIKKNTEFKFKNLKALDVGDFEWTVTPFCYAKDGYEEQKGKASAGSFSIKFASPQKIQTIKPGKMYAE